MAKYMDPFKKIVIKVLFVIGFLTLIVVALDYLNKIDHPFAETFKVEGEITMNQRRIALFEPMIVAPYKTMDIFISDEKESDFEFTSVGGSWEEDKPEGTNIELQVRVKESGGWSKWMDVEGESRSETGDDKAAMASSNPATAMQYKILMYGDGIKTPKVKNIEWTFIKAAKPSSLKTASIPKYSAMPVTSTVRYLALNAGAAGIISRQQWGADESYRYLENNDAEADLIDVDPDWYDEYADELKYARVVAEDSNGDKYKWPLQYPEKVEKFVIHHTATTGNLDDPDQAIRDIYYYHAISRGWGDIGYNYIIDTEGKVYEGRYGGEGVIGAHAGPGNHGSVGIALLGNYEEEDVPEDSIVALFDLIAKKSQIHNIQPLGSSYFRGELMQNIFGHKDIMATTCPGTYLYGKLDVIRTLSAEEMVEEKEKFVKEYDYQDRSELYYFELKPAATETVTITLENIGTKDWGDGTFLVVNKNPDFEGVISFPGSVNNTLAYMSEKKVAPGKNATFKFQIKSGKKGETVYMNLAPVIDGIKKIDDYKVLPVTVQQSDFKYELVTDNFPGESMEPGEQFDAWVKLKNTGNVAWERSGGNAITLRTDHERDRLSKFVFPPASLLAYLEEETVEPGETGTFNISLKAPLTPGYYKEYFTPYIEDIGYMSDTGMYFETTIYGAEYAGEIFSMSDLTEWKQGKSYTLWIKLRNLGKTAWTKDNLQLVFLKEQDLKVSAASLANDTVSPGDLGTINFTVTVADSEELGAKKMLIRPKVDGNNIMLRPIYFPYTVIAKTVAPVYGIEDMEDSDLSEAEGKIRVKLSFAGDPEISGDGTFNVYAGADHLGTVSADGIVSISMKDDQQKITVNGKNYYYPDPVRFGPATGTILRVDNYENAPSWAPDSNDNEYRGVLEVQEDDGALVVINELPLESYLKGLGEVPNSELTEKIKAIMIAARTYALFYMEKDEKFPGKPYYLDDDPEHSQKYIGYGFEKRAPNIAVAVEATRGEVVTYEGELVKTPYFNQSDGTATKSAWDVWGWDAPYLVSVDDSYCKGTVFLGHGVGMSGCGARGMADQGFTYLDILTHYYTGIEVTDLY